MASCTIEGCEAITIARGLCRAHYKRWKRHGDPLGGGTVRGLPRAFIEAGLLQETDECIEWPFGKKEGYGFLNDGQGGTITASRLTCELAHGEAPTNGLEAAHSCGNRGCCNKRHLRWATPTENAADKWLHGTMLVGDRAPSARFTEAEIAAMRDMRASGASLRAISDCHGASISYLSQVFSGQKRRHLSLSNEQDAA